MFTNFFKSISNALHSSDDKIQPWQKNKNFLSALDTNGIVVFPLDKKDLSEMKLLMEKNKNDNGFIQMQSSIRNCSEFHKIVNKEMPKECYIARENTPEKKLVGFVVISKDPSTNIGIISELGVDQDYRREAKSSHVKKAGSSLLFIGCNELFSKNVNSVAVMASEENSLAFYKRWGFKVVSKEDEDDLLIKQKNYQSSEKEFITASLQKPADKIVPGKTLS